MAQVYQVLPCGLDRALGWLEKVFYRGAGLDPQQEMTWRAYTVAVLIFNGIGLLFLYGLLRVQHWLPLNPQDFKATSPHLAFYTASRFPANTNWAHIGWW